MSFGGEMEDSNSAAIFMPRRCCKDITSQGVAGLLSVVASYKNFNVASSPR